MSPLIVKEEVDAKTEADEMTYEELLQALQDESLEVRRHAARDLSRFSEAAKSLCTAIFVETDPGVRNAILTSVIRIGSEESVKGLLEYLRSEDVALRNAVVEALQGLPGAIAPFMESLLCDSDSDVRILAVNVLGSLNHSSVPAWLTMVLERDTHLNVCMAAVDVIIEVGKPEMIPLLEKVRSRFAEEPFAEFAINKAINRLNSRSC